MNTKMILKMEKLFWFFGWCSAAITVVSFAFDSYSWLFTDVAKLTPDGYPIILHLSGLCRAIGETFFAFLIGSVFGMIARKEPATAQANKFFQLACLGFVGQGTIGLFAWIVYVPKALSHFSGSDPTSIFLNIVMIIQQGVTHVAPLLLAVATYILYRHFTQMVAFEAEVV